VTPEQFVKKWQAVNLSERSAAQQHFVDLCALLGEPPPAEADPTGETFTFEKGGATATGGHGWADVWKRGAFAWEYKGPGKDLQAAYYQLKKYADALENPPLLITSDLKRIEIHTNFTNTVKTVHVLQIEDLLDSTKREILRNAFSRPERLRPGVTRQMVTKAAAERFSELAHHLRDKGYEPHRVAHFLNRIIFCMFAEDVGLLPNRVFTRLATASAAHPDKFEEHAKQLFAGMAKGGSVAFEVIDWFNGGLFDDDSTLPLDKKEIELVLKCAELDWSNIEPSIFGTLFERGLDPDKRSQQGAHYTDPDTIMKIVRPVVIEPWEREWAEERGALEKLLDRAKKTVSEAAQKRYYTFLERLYAFRVLDPACGSGNFLYLALRSLKDFEKRVIQEAEVLGLPPPFPRVGPEAVLGIEVNPYAAELARVTIWIGELQWMVENGFDASRNPILKPLNQIECRDAVVTDSGAVAEWPAADAIIGNPPFLGAKLMNRRLGRPYTARLRGAYAGRLQGFSDLVCFWFEKAREQARSGRVKRVGLVATSSIRGGTNRPVLDRIADELTIFSAWSELPWVLDGASVEVSLVCFATNDAAASVRMLDGVEVENVNADLTHGLDLTRARQQPENVDCAYLGIQTSGPHDIDGNYARELLASPRNPNGVPNDAILKPYWNGDDVSGRPRDRWLIDLPLGLSESKAAEFELVFEYLRSARYAPDDPNDTRTLPQARATARDRHAAARWWEPYWPRPEMRSRIARLSRYIVTAETAQHRIFVWLPPQVLPDKNLIVIARDDSTTFGVLQSRIHEVWSLRLGTSLEDRPRYTHTTTFATFPFPDGFTPNISETVYIADPRAVAIAAAAENLDRLRSTWLNPPELVSRVPELAPGLPDRVIPKNDAAAAQLRLRTLTNLYNGRPTWLQHAHRELDERVAAAYGWQWPLSDEEVLKRLLALNAQRADA
jgi:type II restriction/modification system DNA methylase subunit YeeA